MAESKQNYDAIVLGVGGMGSATVHELARRGARVLGLEQFQVAHDRGSSHGETRIIRKAYFEHPDYVPLLVRAYERWFDLEKQTGKRLFTICGCLSLGMPDSELVAGVLKSAAQHQLPVESLSRQEIHQRWPGLHLREDMTGVLEQEAGFLAVEQCVSTHAEVARAARAEIHEGEAVRSWQANEREVSVTTDRGTYRAAKMVVTAGAWATRLLADLGLPLAVRRQVLVWHGSSRAADYQLGRFPCYMAEVPGNFFYGFPIADQRGAKAAQHHHGTPVLDPSQLDRVITAPDLAPVQGFLKEYLPGVDGSMQQACACMYTMTPDTHFILDLHPRYPNIAIAAGFSGHGFKFASAIGEIMADLALQGKTGLPIEMFRIARFGR